MAKENVGATTGADDFKTVREVSLPMKSLLNTTDAGIGSSAIFKYIENTGDKKMKNGGMFEEIHIIELWDAEKRAFEKCKVPLKSQLSELVKSGQIVGEGKIYKVTFNGRVATKSGNKTNSYTVVEVERKS